MFSEDKNENNNNSPSHLISAVCPVSYVLSPSSFKRGVKSLNFTINIFASHTSYFT